MAKIDATQTKNRRTILKLTLIVLAMCVFAYLLVPLYSVVCNVTGINGKTTNSPDKLATQVDTSRWITVDFLATNNNYLPWEFHPNVKAVRVHPGESITVSYFAKNDTDHTMTVQAVPSILPGTAAKFFKKTECFCFKQQTFTAGEAMDMKIVFHIEPQVPKDVTHMTVSYTLFDAKPYKGKKVTGLL